MKKVITSQKPNKTDELVKFIQAAAELKLELIQRRTSRQFKYASETNFILYAVDTDVIKTYTTPWSKGPAISQDGQGYGCIFPTDENFPEETAGIAHILGEYIFYQLEIGWPIFQFPSHFTETENVYNAVAKNANIQDKKFNELFDQFLSDLKKEHPIYDKNKLKIILKEYSENLETTQGEKPENSQLIRGILPELCSYLLGSRTNYSAELIHYYELIADGARANLDDVAKIYQENKQIAPIISSLAGSNDIFEWIHESEYESNWMKVLVTQKRSETNIRNLETDAKALAQLQMTNKKLEKIGGRLIFITGDKLIIKAARDINTEFASKYIRHIHSFLSDALLNIDQNGTGSKNEVSNVDNWLDGLLVKFAGLRSFKESDLKEIINPSRNSKIFTRLKDLSKQMLEDDPNALNNINERWNDFRLTAYQYHLALTPNQQELIADQVQELMKLLKQSDDNFTNSSQFKSGLAAFADFAHDLFYKQWEELIISFAQVGSEFLLMLKGSSSRNPPNVKFDSYKNANQLFSEILAAKKLSDIKPSFNERLINLKKDTLSQDIGQNDLGYIYYLVFASVFAAEQKWSISASLARRAVKLAEIHKVKTKNESNITGREAYFILSTAIRIIAQKPADFEDSRKILDKAITALKKDHSRGTSKCITNKRFIAEKFAIDVAEFHFNLSKDHVGNIPIAIAEKIQQLRDFFRGNIDSINDPNLILAIGINLTQFYSIALILNATTTFTNEQMNSDLKLVIDTIEKLRSNKAHIYETYLIRSYLIFANVLVDKHSIKTKEINGHFSDIKIKEATVTIYDSDRYNRLKKLIYELLT